MKLTIQNTSISDGAYSTTICVNGVPIGCAQEDVLGIVSFDWNGHTPIQKKMNEKLFSNFIMYARDHGYESVNGQVIIGEMVAQSEMQKDVDQNWKSKVLFQIVGQDQNVYESPHNGNIASAKEKILKHFKNLNIPSNFVRFYKEPVQMLNAKVKITKKSSSLSM